MKKENLKPIGVFGGTFDPIHLAHWRLAEEIREEFSLSELRLIPSSVPPHRPPPEATTFQRLKMLRLAIEGNPGFEVDEREVHRKGPSFTIDTLGELRKEEGSRSIAMVIGIDAFLDLHTWHRWQDLFSMAHIIVAERAGYQKLSLLELGPEALKKEVARRLTQDIEKISSASCGFLISYEFTGLSISSTMLRSAISRGRSSRYLVPKAVKEYIDREALYRD